MGSATRWAAIFGSAVMLGSQAPSAGAAVPDKRGSLYVSSAQLTAVRASIKRYPWAREAWQNTLSFANGRLGAAPSPADPNRDYSHDAPAQPNWRDDLYGPGITDGHAAAGLALVYRVTGDRRYAAAAKRILLGWVGAYTHPPGVGGGVAPGHMVAEPIGPMIKLFMAADLLWPALAGGERSAVAAWAQQWIGVGERNADSAKDAPWVDDTHIGSFVANAAPEGNSALGQRAMAMWAAAVAGPQTLRAALAWNWDHVTPGGHRYGWDDVIGHLIIPGTGGETIEGRYRSSVFYGLFGWAELLTVADLARHAGFRIDLFTYRAPGGSTLLSVAPFYAPVLVGSKPNPYPGTSEGGGSYDQARAEYRAVFETAYRNCPDGLAVCRTYRSVVTSGGPKQRGDNYDPHLTRWNALLGRP